jgi:hypothetical protein
MPNPTFDAHKNFAIGVVATAPSPPGSGTSLTLQAGQGQLFPVVPFNATVCPPNVLPTYAVSEIVRVTARSGDVLTIARYQEGTALRAIALGDYVIATVTVKTITDVEGAFTGVARTDTPNTFTGGGMTLYGTAAQLSFVESAQPPNSRLWDVVASSTYLQVRALTDDGASVYSYSYFGRPGDLYLYRDLYEKQRTTPLGHWIPIPYNAGNFTAATGAWTVEAADVEMLAYTLIGRTAIVAFNIFGSSVSAATQTLRIALPVTAAAPSAVTPFHGFDGAWLIGAAQPSGATLILRKDPFGSTNWATTTNGTHLYGRAEFSI